EPKLLATPSMRRYGSAAGGDGLAAFTRLSGSCAAPASRSLVRRATRSSLLRFRLRVVALQPLRDDLVAVLRRPREVVLDETLLVIRGHALQTLRDVPH